ncbi:carbon-nitrogen hydrolase family protein [Duganella levis]|uniref:Carbon-nitrogen hydrolase family protein n=1 Tax=Duganella levis TaxID=2692169 RepID=A0ABW9W0T2_9BURK|nr:carbon-nitrogen hydrolase family protein [Duganella levis]MYN27514.1 carbon-nitrogen hydrolase family protein [Duganella levis]
MRIAAAQTPSVAGDIATNLATHLRFIAAAHAEGLQLLVFPELSLCGYELPLLRECALSPHDARLAPLRAAAVNTGMTIIVGAPLIDDGAAQPCIASITFRPDSSATTYRKQYLHAGEDAHVQPGPRGAQAHALHGQRYVEAICADTTHPEHARAAANAGATLYVAGVLISNGGYEADAALLRRYAEEHRMTILMANHGAPSGGYTCAGKSAIWAPGGTLIAQAEGPGDYLVIAEENNDWHGRTVPVKTAT